jgi:hypothetical protein
MTRRAARRRACVDAAVAAYRQWHSERDAVRAAYRVWVAASAWAEPSAFEAYQSALDREERAAKARRAPDQTGLAHRLVLMPALPGAW